MTFCIKYNFLIVYLFHICINITQIIWFLLFLPKYYYFLLLFLQKFTKQIILYIYNPILWRVPSQWWKIDFKGSALSHCKERKKKTLAPFRYKYFEEMILDSSFGCKSLSQARISNASGIYTQDWKWPLLFLNLLKTGCNFAPKDGTHSPMSFALQAEANRTTLSIEPTTA